jgi:hypothetical protein
MSVSEKDIDQTILCSRGMSKGLENEIDLLGGGWGDLASRYHLLQDSYLIDKGHPRTIKRVRKFESLKYQ